MVGCDDLSSGQSFLYGGWTVCVSAFRIENETKAFLEGQAVPVNVMVDFEEIGRTSDDVLGEIE